MKAENPQPEILSRLRDKRRALALSQKQLAEMAGITRQAVCALEANQYCPATSVALQLARALGCRVEELFSIKEHDGEVVEGKLLGEPPRAGSIARAQVTQIGRRYLIRALEGSGELANLSAAADGLMVDWDPRRRSATVRLLKDRESLGQKIVIGGCDPAMFLAGAHLRNHLHESLVPCLMGSGLALEALHRGEIHVAGIHLAEEKAGVWQLPNLRAGVSPLDCIVVTFAYWEEGLIVQRGNPKKIRTGADLAKPRVKIVNREPGSGARRLLDKQLRAATADPKRVKGYGDEVLSHLDVASRIKAGLADAGIGVRSAAAICGLDFVPLQRERYDLVIPRAYYETLTGIQALLDTIVSKPFRDEIQALGGYDTRDTGKLVQ